MLKKLCFLLTVLCISVMPSLVLGQDAKPFSDRTAELLAREACLEALDTAQSHEICSDWVARAHCLSNYLELRESFEKNASSQVLFALLQGADARLNKDVNCTPMSKVRLWLEILDLGLSEYDPKVLYDNDVIDNPKGTTLICSPGSAPCRRVKTSENAEIWRLRQWSKILGFFPQILPEQQLFICQELSTSTDLKAIYKTNEGKAAVNACISLPAKFDDIQESAARMLARFEELDAKLINDDARAVMLMLKLKLRQFTTAKADLMAIDLAKILPEAKTRLRNAILAHASNIYGQEQINEGACYPMGLQVKQASNMGRQELYELLLETPHPLAPFVAQSEMLHNWLACSHVLVADRMAWLFNAMPNDLVVHEIGQNLLNRIQRQRDARLAFALADAMASLKPAALEAFTQKLGPILAAQVLNFAAYLPNDERHPLLKAVRQFSGPNLRPEIDFLLGIAFHQDGQTSEALKYWQEVIQRGPNAPWSREATDLSDRINAPKGK